MPAMCTHSPKFVPEQRQGHYPSICFGYSPRRVGLSMQSQSSGLCRGSEERGPHRMGWEFSKCYQRFSLHGRATGISCCSGFTLSIIITELVLWVPSSGGDHLPASGGEEGGGLGWAVRPLKLTECLRSALISVTGEGLTFAQVGFRPLSQISTMPIFPRSSVIISQRVLRVSQSYTLSKS